jgi:hypothetical protein
MINKHILLMLIVAVAAMQAANAASPKAPTAKIPVIAGTYTPPATEDWGCGTGKPITIREDKSRICPIDRKYK